MRTDPPPLHRCLYLALAWLALGLAALGALLPLMPTTVFLLIAAWAFARSAPHRRAWLRAHPRFGPVIRAWEDHRGIPARARRLAWTAMAVSWGLMALALGAAHPATLAGGAAMLCAALWLGRLPTVEPPPTPSVEAARHTATARAPH